MVPVPWCLPLAFLSEHWQSPEVLLQGPGSPRVALWDRDLWTHCLPRYKPPCDCDSEPQKESGVPSTPKPRW